MDSWEFLLFCLVCTTDLLKFELNDNTGNGLKQLRIKSKYPVDIDSIEKLL